MRATTHGVDQGVGVVTIRRPQFVAFASVAIGIGVVLGWAGWPQPGRTIEFASLIVAAMLTSVLGDRQLRPNDWAIMPLSFVIDFTSLLFLGPASAMITATTATVAQHFTEDDGGSPQQLLSQTAIGIVSIQAAAMAHQALGGTLGHFEWPWQAVPILAAVLAYCFVKCAVMEIVAPLCRRQAFNRSWLKRILTACPVYVVGASLAVALVEVVHHQLWPALPVAAIPLCFVCRAYLAALTRTDAEQTLQSRIASAAQAMCAVDGQGRFVVWNPALERMLGCPGEQALGRSLPDALPALGKSDVARAINETLTSQQPRTVSHLSLPSGAASRSLQVSIVPVVGGATLLWQDLTERAHAEQALKRSEERLALAAEGANDGLWAWDFRSDEFYASSRWNAMLGLPQRTLVGGPDAWLQRVHVDDAPGLKQALAAHLAGKADHLHHEHRLRHEDGTYRRFLCRGVASRGAAQRPLRIAGSMTETTEKAIAQERLRDAGFLDPLTSLSNRSVFVEKLGRRLAEFKERRGGNRFAVLYLDLDRFKIVNDSLGHLVGDELLKIVSRRLESCLRQGDALARLGGDEFAILLNGLDDEPQANAIAFRIQEALSASFSIGGREVFTTASIGIALGRAQYNNPEEIMRDADTAMYHAKSRGKARHELFDADMHARALDRLGLESDLRNAVAQRQFEVHYQPIVSLASGMCVGFESLVRWTRNGEAISPAIFVPIAEELGLIEPLGSWVLARACATFADWQRRFPAAGLDCITVNVSSRQLLQPNFPRVVEQAIQQSGLKTCDLRLEITETALMDNPQAAAEMLQDLRDFGVKIYLDDFGTGYSSLSHLHKLPVDALKIDRSFVKSLSLPDRPAIVESILALARTLNTSVVAEGIEEQAQASALERLGCTHAQGYLFSRPLSAAAAEAIVAAGVPLGPKKIDQPMVPVNDPTCYPTRPFEWPEHLEEDPLALANSSRTLADEICAFPRV